MSLDKAILDALKGNFVPVEAKKERLDICNACDKKRGLFCSECKCLLNWKCSMPEEKCPLNKWK